MGADPATASHTSNHGIEPTMATHVCLRQTRRCSASTMALPGLGSKGFAEEAAGSPVDARQIYGVRSGGRQQATGG